MADGNVKEGSVFWMLSVKTDDAEKKIDSFSNKISNLNNLFGLFKVSVFLKGLKSIGETISKVTTKQMTYLQTLNTFNRTMGEFTGKATIFRDKMQNMLGIDAEDTMKSMATIQRIVENFGIGSDRAYIMSKNITQLAADATVMGFSFDEALTKLRSGLTGEIKGMRQMGVALDEATLQQTLYSLGINKTVDSLTRAQKTELLYYQIIKQTEGMQGELGRTMMSPANMARIMKQEFTQLGRAIGTIFIPVAMKIIPVVRAITQELIRLAEWIAGEKFDYKETDYLSDYAGGLDDISLGLDDIEDSATGAAKAMNKMLMPFDELNNINFSSGSSSGIGSIGGGPLFDNIEDLPQYNIFKNLDKSINDSVENWKKKIEELLPVFKVVGIAAAGAFAFVKLAEFLKWVDDIKTALVGLGITSSKVKIGLGILFTIGGIIAQWKGTQKLLDGDFSLWSILETLGGTALGTFGIVTILRQLHLKGGLVELNKTGNQIKFGLGIMLAIASFETILDGITKDDMWKKIYGALGMGFSVGTLALSTGKIGLKWSIPIAIAATFGSFTVESIMDAFNAGKVKDEQKAVQSELTALFAGGVAGAFGGGVLGAKIGAIGGPLGIAIGATLGALTGGIAAKIAEVRGLNEAQKELNETNSLFVSILDNESAEYLEQKTLLDDLISTYDARIASINSTREADLLALRVTEDYAKDLDALVDSNGRVIDGNEERVKFILNELNSAIGTEYQLNDGLITSNDEVIGSYDDMRKNIDELIQKKKEEAEREADIELYREAYKQRRLMVEEFNKKYSEYQRLQNDLMEREKNGLKKGSDEWKAYQRKVIEAKKLANEAGQGMYEASELAKSRSIAAFGGIPDGVLEIGPQMADNFDNVTDQGVNASANTLNNSLKPTGKLTRAIYGFADNFVAKLKSRQGFDVNSPSKRIRDEVGKWIPLGLAQGIDDNAYAVEDSVQDLVNRTRVDMQDFSFDTGADFVSSINGKIQSQTAVAFNDNTLEEMANATYQGMARALIENNDDYNPYFDIHIGNDKVYSGYGNYKSNESNRYGVKV